MFDRVIVVAPTRSTCVNLHHLVRQTSLPETLLQRECGTQLAAAIAELPLGGFGVVAGTGVGKSAAIRDLCRRVRGKDATLTVGIVTLEHRATASTRGHDVLVVTPGVAVQWAKNGTISPKDLIVLDEVHQTSDHLELTMALLKRLGCTFVWMSATIDPEVYRDYLGARAVIECDAYDADRRAKVKYHWSASAQWWLDKHLGQIADEQRGVAVFVPTRAEAERLATEFDGRQGVNVSFYHGGEPAEKLRAYIEGSIPRPYVIIMTSAGASSLNVSGLGIVVIDDKQFKEVVVGGKRVLRQAELDSNTLLQMAGRVDGRALNGEVHILTERHLDLRTLRPVAPDFTLGGDLELLAMTTSKMGVDARELELIGGLDTFAYADMFNRLLARGIVQVQDGNPQLTRLGERIERLPVPVAWGELIAKAQDVGDRDLLITVCLTACTGELYHLVRRGWMSFDDDLVVRNSDHLTCHNIVAETLRRYGRASDNEYRLRSNGFQAWCKERNYSQKEIRNSALLLVSLLQSLGVGLPELSEFAPVEHGESLHQRFIELLAAVQSMDYVYREQHQGRVVFGNSKHGVTYGQSVLGTIRYWNSLRGQPCASIEGTEIPLEVVARYAKYRIVEVMDETESGVLVSCRLLFGGEERLDTVTREVSRSEVPEWLLQAYRRQQDTQNRLAQLRQQQREEAAELTRLRGEARSLRDQINGLAHDNWDRLPDYLRNPLLERDVDDIQLPYSSVLLGPWITGARALIARVQEFLQGNGAQRDQSVPADQLSQLAARFGGR